MGSNLEIRCEGWVEGGSTSGPKGSATGQRSSVTSTAASAAAAPAAAVTSAAAAPPVAAAAPHLCDHGWRAGADAHELLLQGGGEGGKHELQLAAMTHFWLCCQRLPGAPAAAGMLQQHCGPQPARRQACALGKICCLGPTCTMLGCRRLAIKEHSCRHSFGGSTAVARSVGTWRPKRQAGHEHEGAFLHAGAARRQRRPATERETATCTPQPINALAATAPQLALNQHMRAAANALQYVTACCNYSCGPPLPQR